MSTNKKFRIVGRRAVAGRQPGETLDESDLEGVNVDALIAGGHVVEERPAKLLEHPLKETTAASVPRSCINKTVAEIF